jgi:uncharacterized Zn finger protein
MKRITNEKWKSYPIHISIPCRKCGAKTSELYQLLDGGFIHARCSTCGADNPFSKDEFIFLSSYPCPTCHKDMESEQLKEDYENACYYCENCNSYIRIADLLPDK